MLHADDAVKCYCCRSLGVRHQVCVPFGHFQASVPHKFSNDGLPVTLLGQKARECMAKTVKDELVTTIEHPLVQLHFLHCLGERLTHIKEHGARLAWKDEKSGIVGKPVFKGRLHCLSHEGKATAPIFALPNENGAVFKVQVAYLQFGDLAESQPALHGDEAHEPRLGVLLLNLSQQCFGLRFCKKAGALVVHFGHDKLNKRRGAVPQLPHQGLVHDAPHLAQNVFNGLRGITLTSLLQREFLQVGHSDFIQWPVVQGVVLQVVLVATGIVVGTGLGVGFQPVRLVLLPCLSKCGHYFGLLGQNARQDFFLGFGEQALPHRVGVLCGDALAAVAHSFSDALTSVWIIIVDGIGDIRFALVFFGTGGPLIYSVESSSFAFVLLLVGGHISPLIFATKLRPTVVNCDQVATCERDVHRQAEVNNPLIDKGNIHQVARGVQGVILSLSASQAEGCGFKSRFPLQRFLSPYSIGCKGFLYGKGEFSGLHQR